MNWHVPIDDTSHWKYTFTFYRDHPIDESWGHNLEVRTADYRPVRNRLNRYLQDRDSMTTECYTGIGFDFVVHDLFATESQGPIQDRSQEHLGAMDRPIAIERRMMLKAILDLQEGIEPANVVRSPERCGGCIQSVKWSTSKEPRNRSAGGRPSAPHARRVACASGTVTMRRSTGSPSRASSSTLRPRMLTGPKTTSS